VCCVGNLHSFATCCQVICNVQAPQRSNVCPSLAGAMCIVVLAGLYTQPSHRIGRTHHHAPSHFEHTCTCARAACVLPTMLTLTNIPSPAPRRSDHPAVPTLAPRPRAALSALAGTAWLQTWASARWAGLLVSTGPTALAPRPRAQSAPASACVCAAAPRAGAPARRFGARSQEGRRVC